MRTEPGATTVSSPEILCVSDRRETTARLRDAVASCRHPETIETTTDPTVVSELVAVWDIECVVADADMEPVCGTAVRATLRAVDPQVSVIVVSTESTATESVTVKVDADKSNTLSERLDQVHPQCDDDTTTEAHSNTSSQFERLAEADSRCDLVTELEALVSEYPAVVDHQLWLDTRKKSLESTAHETAKSTVPPTVREAINTASPQQATDTESAELEIQPTDRTESTRTVVYPLGDSGAIAVVVDGVTPIVAERLQGLTTVAGMCLDHYESVADIEARFRQTAERNRVLSQFARTVAHDLNSPLSVVYGRIELAMADETETGIHLQAALNAAQRVDSLITDHLQSIEAVDGDSEREPVSAQTVAIQAWRIVDPSTARLQVEPQLETVEANAIRLQQLFENLIRNAIEHGSEESVGLGTTPSRDPHAVFDDDSNSVTVTIKPTEFGFAVCDDGPGVPPAERDEIFKSGYTTTESGSGLGLHIVREIVDAHDWEISVTESESGGARFEVDTQ